MFQMLLVPKLVYAFWTCKPVKMKLHLSCCILLLHKQLWSITLSGIYSLLSQSVTGEIGEAGVIGEFGDTGEIGVWTERVKGQHA